MADMKGQLPKLDAISAYGLPLLTWGGGFGTELSLSCQILILQLG